MKLLIIGRGINLGQMLRYYGVDSVTSETVTNPTKEKFDISITYGAWSSRRVLGSLLLLPGKKIIRLQGSDVYRISSGTKRSLKIAKMMGATLLYASQELKDIIGLDGPVWITPVDTRLFKPAPKMEKEVDVLYYYTKGQEETYCLEKFRNQMRETGESFTILNGSVPIEKMPAVYSRHRKYIRYTTHDANPKMPYEAYLCGCESWDNGRRITHLPDYMDMRKAIPELLEILDSLLLLRPMAFTGYRHARTGKVTGSQIAYRRTLF